MTSSRFRSATALLARRVGLAFFIGMGVALTACDSGGGNSSPGTITGQWQSSIETDSVTYDLQFELDTPENEELSGSRLVGNGELAAATDSWAFQIPSGTFRRPVLGLTLRFEMTFDGRRLPVTINGTVDEDFQEISADISGGPPQFEERPITITRP